MCVKFQQYFIDTQFILYTDGQINKRTHLPARFRAVQLHRSLRIKTSVYCRRYTFQTELLDFWTFSIVRYSRKLKTRRFGNWICFRPHVGGKDT
jgi:hypothetical protein